MRVALSPQGAQDVWGHLLDDLHTNMTTVALVQPGGGGTALRAALLEDALTAVRAAGGAPSGGLVTGLKKVSATWCQ